MQVDHEVRYNHHNRLVRSVLCCSQGGVYGPVLTLSPLLGVLLVSYLPLADLCFADALEDFPFQSHWIDFLYPLLYLGDGSLPHG